MGIFSAIGNIGKKILGGVTGGLSDMAVDGIMGMMGGGSKGAREDAIKDQQQLMNYQQQLNQQNATFTQGLQKDMWNATTREQYGLQVQGMKDAGLNPALMYGGGASGGGTTGSAAVAPSTGGNASSMSDRMGMALQMKQIGLQERQVESQVELNEANAEKAKADAAKTSGVDTTEANSRIEQIKNQIKTNEIGWDKAEQEIRQMKNSNQITEETMNDTIVGIRHEMAGKELDNELKRANIDLTKAQRESVRQGILQSWEKVKIEWKNADSNRRNAIVNEESNKIKRELPSIGQVNGKMLNTVVDGIYNKLHKTTKKGGDGWPDLD